MSFLSSNQNISQHHSVSDDSSQQQNVESPKTDTLTVPSIWSRANPLELCEEHRFVIPDLNKLKYEMDIYQWRSAQPDTVMKPYYVESRGDTFGNRELRVFVQKIQPFSGISDKLSFRDGINLLMDFLKGFKILFEKFGSFKIQEFMVCIDNKRHGKVWINKDFSKNEFTPSSSNQIEMIYSIFSIVQSKMEAHLLLSKLRKSIENSYTFDQAVNSAQKIIYQSRYSRCGTATSQHSQRRYFPKTPDNNVVSNKSPIDGKQGLRQSTLVIRQKLISNQYLKPPCLQFKSNSKRVKRSNKHISLLKKSTLEIGQKQNNTKSNQILTFSTARTPKYSRKSRNMINLQKSSYNYVQKSQQVSKSSRSSRQLSFKSYKIINKNPLLSHPSIFRPLQTHKQLVTRKRTASISYQCPNHLIKRLSQQIPTIKDSNSITKSMAIIRNQFQTKALGSKDQFKEFVSSQTLAEQALMLTSRRNSKNIDFINIRMVEQSLINESIIQQPKTNLIGQLKHSVFNRIDDLKQSQIIIQDNEQQSIINSRSSTAQEIVLAEQPISQQKYLRKISNKLVQSMTIQKSSEQSFIISETIFQRTTLDRFIRNRRQTLLNPVPLNLGSFLELKSKRQEVEDK